MNENKLKELIKELDASLENRMTYNYLYLTLAAFLLCGCTNPLNRPTAGKYYEMGAQAEQKGDLEAARESYRRATLNADWGHLGPRPKAVTLYEYGRISGYLCDPNEAEKSLMESLKLQDQDRDARLELRPPTLLELARLYYDTGRLTDALPYYKEGIQLLRKLNVEKKEPIRFAITLEEYADCLERAGQSTDAETIQEEAKIIRMNYAGPEIKEPFQRYNTRCHAETETLIRLRHRR